MADRKTLGCGCEVETYRDFLGRVVGKIVAHDPNCSDQTHAPERVIVMPGRENARPE
jgi:hypothetical protein